MNDHHNGSTDCRAATALHSTIANPGQETAVAITVENTGTSVLNHTDEKIFNRIGQLTRTLHNNLRELGYDQRLQQANTEISDSKDGLAYIISKTTQAAEHSLLAVENAKPIQENLSISATNLSRLWSQAFETTPSTFMDQRELKDILVQTLEFLNDVPKQTDATQAYLTEIMMAQDFQDLTGQVIQKITRAIETIEREMLQLLIDNASIGKTAAKQNNGLMNGPVINPQQHGTLTNQDQVDSLLAELGF